MEYSVNSKEKIYLGLKVFFTIAVLIGFIALFSINKKTGAMMGVLGFMLCSWLVLLIRHAVAIGYLRGMRSVSQKINFRNYLKLRKNTRKNYN